MPTLNISPATSFSFRLETASGTIRDGDTIADNYLYENVATFYDCEALDALPGYCQPFLCTDTISFQYEYENSPFYPEVIVTDIDDNYLLTVASTNTVDDLWEASIDMSALTCGECYRVKIRSVMITPNGLILCAEDGTFENPGTTAGTATGGNNSIASSNTYARSGSRSGQVTANGSPSAGSDTVLYCSADPGLSANTYYLYRMYVYEEDGGTNFAGTEGSYYIDVSDYSDAVILAETRATPENDGRDTWLLVETVFRTGTDVVGNPKLMIDIALPTASGEVWIDDMSLSEDTGTPVVEATGQRICIASSLPCHLALTWTSDHDTTGQYTMGIDYSTALINKAYVEAEFYRTRWEDEDYTRGVDSGGSSWLGVSRLRLIRMLKTDWLPPYMLEKLAMAIKHDTFTIAGIQYTALDSAFEPNFPEDNIVAATVEVDFIRSEYDYYNSSC